MKSVDVASIAELNEILEKSPVTLVDFSARWCGMLKLFITAPTILIFLGPCKKLLPMLEDLSKEPKMSSVNFIKIDVDDNQEISEVMNVQAMPVGHRIRNKRLIMYFF
jgi:thiol-disulfide isomerase/thioredoxin